MNVIVILCDTLRRDHCSPYTGGRPLNACWSAEAPPWAVPTPHMQRLADRGTRYDNCWCGSTPCMPARRDIYTGRYEFLERGWGPLEEDDLDLPRQVSGSPNRSITAMRREGLPVSDLVSDHFHLWEQGAGNYHMGYSGFQFIRGIEGDGLYTDPLEPGVDFSCPSGEEPQKLERHYRNMHFLRRDEQDWTCARVFRTAADWLERNRGQHQFYLHIDCFPPHEPLDPPEHLLERFWPEGYRNSEHDPFQWPYAKWRDAGLTERQMQFARARYAANVTLVDRWLGHFLDKMDELGLWENTLLLFTTDHGTYNGDHGRLGKLQTHQHDAVGHIPLIACHPTLGHGETRNQLVQLVDIYPTVLRALDRPLPKYPDGRPLHGVNLLPTLEDPAAPTRHFALAGQFGKSVTITDGDWILHQSPGASNQPLYWHGHHLSRFVPPYELGPFREGRRAAQTEPWPEPTWLSDKRHDPNELINLAEHEPDKRREMQRALRETLVRLEAPPEQMERLQLGSV